MKTASTLLFAFVLLLLPVMARAETLDDANRAFAAGRFEESTISYQNLIAQHGYSAPVLFDLGNAYYSQGDYAKAILAYKRAQWLAPSDPDIAANLRQAQAKAGVAIAEPRWNEKIAAFLSPAGWAWSASAAWVLLCASIFARFVLTQNRTLFSLAGAASALLLVAAVAGIILSAGQLHQAVVTDKDAKALISPFPAAQTVFVPPAGETVAVQKTYSDYYLVSDANGHSGWVSKSQLTPIVER
jgi:tetratricopeptide (TPR) repeat protein